MSFISVPGILGHDASTRAAQKSGEEYITFSLAEPQFGKDENGEPLPSTWYSCIFFGKRAAALAPYLTKGSKVTVIGQLSPREYTGKDGAPRFSLDVRVYDIALQDSKKGESKPRQRSDDGRQYYERPSRKARKYAQTTAFDDEDIPI